MYREWVADPARGQAMLQDALEESSGRNPARLGERGAAIREMLAEPPLGSAAARVLLKSAGVDPRAAAVLAEAALDPSLSGHLGFRFLLAVLTALAV